MRQNFTISEEDWAELLRLSGEALTAYSQKRPGGQDE